MCSFFIDPILTQGFFYYPFHKAASRMGEIKPNKTQSNIENNKEIILYKNNKALGQRDNKADRSLPFREAGFYLWQLIWSPENRTR